VPPVQPAEVRGLARRCRRIDGWFSPQAAGLFALLDDVQRRAGVEGHLFEIGAHHGKSAIVLGALAREHETLGVCDVFGGQDLNASGSGSGDRARFEGNLRRFLPGFDRLAVHETLSSALTAEDVGRPQRLFHVDGGHLAGEALGDLRLAAEVLHDRGAIVVDDPFRPEWPGVTEGILAFLDERPEYAPVALGFNKLVLVRRGARDLYDAALAPPDWRYFDRRRFAVKALPIGEDPVAIFYVPTDRKIAWVEVAAARIQWLRAAVPRRARRLLARVA
jgi:hypothetical protein